MWILNSNKKKLPGCVKKALFILNFFQHDRAFSSLLTKLLNRPHVNINKNIFLEGKMNFLILNNSKNNKPLQISTHIAAYLINQLDLNVYIITKEKVNARENFMNIDRSKALKLGLITADDYNHLLKKVLFLDNLPINRIPQVLILESLVSIIKLLITF